MAEMDHARLSRRSITATLCGGSAIGGAVVARLARWPRLQHVHYGPLSEWFGALVTGGAFVIAAVSFRTEVNRRRDLDHAARLDLARTFHVGMIYEMPSDEHRAKWGLQFQNDGPEPFYRIEFAAEWDHSPTEHRKLAVLGAGKAGGIDVDQIKTRSGEENIRPRFTIVYEDVWNGRWHRDPDGRVTPI